jgi:N-acyl homoserine lactone hydrolase
LTTGVGTARITLVELAALTVDSSLNCYLTEPGRPETVPVCAYLVEAGAERYLVDTGAPPEADCAESYRPLVTGSRRALAAALPAGTLGALSGVILTHLHWDHAGGLAAVPAQVPVFVQQAEVEYARLPLPLHRRGYGRGLTHRPAWEDRTFVVLDGDAVLPGDVRVLLTPGHSPGSQTVMVDSDGFSALLTGDTVPTERNWRTDIPPGVHTSLADWYSSMERLRPLAALIYPGHGPMFAATDGPVIPLGAQAS